jgi:polyhydroxybutyrate depolymerase
MWRIVKRVGLVLAATVAVLAGAAFFLLHQTLPSKPAFSGRVETGVLAQGGLRRTWVEYLPRTLAERPALVVVLHGSMGSGQRARADDFGYDFDRLADERGFIAVYPQGFKGHWNAASKIGPYEAKKRNVDDVAFLHALVAREVKVHDVDPSQVFVVGVSNGGSMVVRLALESPAFARAYAVISESLPTPANLAAIPSGRPVSILFMNGTADPIVPWAGGEVVLWPVLASRGPVRSVADSVKYFLSLAKVQARASIVIFPDTDRTDGSTVSQSTWVGPGQQRIVQIIIAGGGHGAPHPQKIGMRLLGRSNRDFHAADAIWNFFDELQRRRAPRRARG